MNLAEPELARLAAVLDALESFIEPLMREIPLATEPATVFCAAPEEEA
jgi:hypothetical protein